MLWLTILSAAAAVASAIAAIWGRLGDRSSRRTAKEASARSLEALEQIAAYRRSEFRAPTWQLMPAGEAVFYLTNHGAMSALEVQVDSFPPGYVLQARLPSDGRITPGSSAFLVIHGRAYGSDDLPSLEVSWRWPDETSRQSVSLPLPV